MMSGQQLPPPVGGPKSVECIVVHFTSGSRCEFVLNERADLLIFADGAFDFVVSFLVLQHMPPPLAESCMREVVRVLKPGGIGYFQIPEYSRNPVKRILMKHAPIEALFWLLPHRSRQPFQMYGRDLDEIVAVIIGLAQLEWASEQSPMEESFGSTTG